MSLITLEEYKKYLAIDDTENDIQLTLMLVLVEAEISARCNRIFERPEAAVTEYFDGDGMSDFIVPRYFPVVSITTLNDDTAVPPTYGSDTLIDSDYHVLYDGRIELNGLVFAKGKKNIKLVYLGGWESGETDPKFVAFKKLLYGAISWNIERAGKEADVSRAVQNLSVSESYQIELPPDIRRALGIYRRRAFGA